MALYFVLEAVTKSYAQISITFAQAYLYISGDSLVINPVYLLL